ncbi:MAG: pyridoxamine 5'-phosphate oxidase family protein [Rhodobacteraceae bacterium]|nr:pyridoxamine 5'-phosphate oxidase family protein [Paracoccaceae bacterium]
MTHAFHEIAFTDAVRQVQAEEGSAALWARHQGGPVTHDRLGRDEAAFLAERDSFYLASVSETGWPYMQHRGGPAGFVRVLDPARIGWAEFAGNRQYITTGNLRGNDRVSLFFMDYARKGRLKLFGRARVLAPDDPALAALVPDGTKARVQRGLIVQIEGFEWNCPQHIPDRYSMENVQAAMGKMAARIAELEAALAAKG